MIGANIRKLQILTFFRTLYFFMPILALFYAGRGLSTFQLVSLEAFLIVVMLLAEVPTGIIADKIGRKNSVIIMILFGVAGNIFTIYAFSYPVFIIAETLFGIGYAFGSGSFEALAYDTLKVDKKETTMTKVWGTIGSAGLIGGVIAALIGGYLARSHQPETFVLLLWLHLIGLVIALSIGFTLKEPPEQKKIKHANPLTLFKQSANDIWKNKKLRRIILLLIFTVPFYHTLGLLFQPYFIQADVAKSWFGVAVALGLLGGALFMHQAHRIEKKLGMKSTLFIATILPGVFYLIMIFFIGPLQSFLWFIILKAVIALRDPLFAQYQNDHIQSHNRATVLSIISMASAFYIAAMRFVLGGIATYNLLLAFGVMGGIVIISSFLFRIDESALA